MSGRLAVVTGGSRGIGAAICCRLARDGYAVAVNYARSAAEAEAVVEEIVRGGGQAASFCADVSDPAQLEAMFDNADRRLGRLAALVNNAGIIGPLGRVVDVPAAGLQQLLSINIAGTVLASQHAARRMSTRSGGSGGGIVNLSSTAARLGGAGENVVYAMTKGAIDAFTAGLGRELAEDGVRVNAVAPGLIATDMSPPERVARMSPSIPMRRAGEPAEIAEAVAWLLSPAASYVTGTTLTVSGGR
ncbi:MAG: SDR family oxidoreductase [Janthinobacterium lividum]